MPEAPIARIKEKLARIKDLDGNFRLFEAFGHGYELNDKCFKEMELTNNE